MYTTRIHDIKLKYTKQLSNNINMYLNQKLVANRHIRKEGKSVLKNKHKNV